LPVHSTQPSLVPPGEVQQLPPRHTPLVHSLPDAQDPVSLAPCLTQLKSSVRSKPDRQLRQRPEPGKQKTQPSLVPPGEVQQLPPRHTPLLHSLPDAQDPVSLAPCLTQLKSPVRSKPDRQLRQRPEPGKQKTQPSLVPPGEVQQLPPRHTPLLHSLPDAQDPVSLPPCLTHLKSPVRSKPERHFQQRPVLPVHSAQPALVPSGEVQQLPARHTPLLHSLPDAQDPVSWPPCLTQRPVVPVHLAQPSLVPSGEVQQLPPRHTPLLHSLPDAHAPVSGVRRRVLSAPRRRTSPNDLVPPRLTQL
jgi:hypothetical protein